MLAMHFVALILLLTSNCVSPFNLHLSSLPPPLPSRLTSSRTPATSRLTSSRCAPASSRLCSIRPDLEAAIGTEPPVAQMVDEASLPTFSIPPDKLIGLAKAFTAAQIAGTAGGGDGGVDWFADDFRFVAPVVGPFDKKLFIDSLSNFDLPTAFPDLLNNFHHWRVCPFEPNRVYYSIKFQGTNTGEILSRPATGKKVESPIQAQSLTFNERGEVTKFTIGYVLDKETGNTGGLGGVFGLFHAIGYGLPFPEAQPYRPSLFYGGLMSVNKGLQSAFRTNPAAKRAVDGLIETFSK